MPDFYAEIGRGLSDVIPLERWEHADRNERAELAREAHAHIREQYGLKPNDFDVSSELPDHVRGKFYPETGRIRVNEKLLADEEPYQLIETLAHENRHAIQERALSGGLAPDGEPFDSRYVETLQHGKETYDPADFYGPGYLFNSLETDARDAGQRVSGGYKEGVIEDLRATSPGPGSPGDKRPAPRADNQSAPNEAPAESGPDGRPPKGKYEWMASASADEIRAFRDRASQRADAATAGMRKDGLYDPHDEHSSTARWEVHKSELVQASWDEAVAQSRLDELRTDPKQAFDEARVVADGETKVPQFRATEPAASPGEPGSQVPRADNQSAPNEAPAESGPDGRPPKGKYEWMASASADEIRAFRDRASQRADAATAGMRKDGLYDPHDEHSSTARWEVHKSELVQASWDEAVAQSRLDELRTDPKQAFDEARVVADGETKVPQFRATEPAASPGEPGSQVPRSEIPGPKDSLPRNVEQPPQPGASPADRHLRSYTYNVDAPSKRVGAAADLKPGADAPKQQSPDAGGPAPLRSYTYRVDPPFAPDKPPAEQTSTPGQKIVGPKPRPPSGQRPPSHDDVKPPKAPPPPPPHEDVKPPKEPPPKPPPPPRPKNPGI